ncbi:hypothetical protein AAIH70_11555 [Neorhizobium sp. BT27B]|uniref:hypothetical protein n=1 Tax=Neorhizobium sp. BT27B TaxID=3142625 RepID=UPI003D2DD310
MDYRTRPLTGVERLRLFAGMPDVFTFDEEDAAKAVEELSGEPLLVDRLREAEAKIEALEAMRPHWAKGYSSDSIAAQVSAGSLNQVWKLLGVDNQTAAMMKLRELVAV